MTVVYYGKDGAKEELTSGLICFVLPFSGNVAISDIESKAIYINGLSFAVIKGIFTIPIKDVSLQVEVDETIFDVRVLCRETSNEMRFDYNVLGKNFERNLIQNRMDMETFNSAIEDEEDDLKLTLCTFNRKFDNVTRDQGLEEMADCSDKLPHIFQKPKQHLKQINEIRPAAVASRVGQESISHLASHSENWKGIKANGLIPERLLSRTLVDDFAIYENLAVKTLVNKLYRRMMALNSDTLDCSMQIEMDDGLVFGDEQKSYFHARNVLLKGMDDEAVQYNQMILDEQREFIQHILDKLIKCKSTSLYRHLKKQRSVVGKLKKTNIFMMDKYYKHAYRLWDLAGNEPEVVDDAGIECIEEEYTLYCKLLLVFSLEYFNFKTGDCDDIFEGNKFCSNEYRFKRWNVVLRDTNVSDFALPAIEMTMTSDNIVRMKKSLAEYDLPVGLVPYSDVIRVEDGCLAFTRVLSDDEQDDLTKAVKKAWPNNKQNHMANDFRQEVYSTCANYKAKEKTVLFVPWKHLIPNNTEEAKCVFDKLMKAVDATLYDRLYILIPSRPNEYNEVKDDTVLNRMISYGMANKSTGLSESKHGILPIGIGDINSYRRYTKVLLENMVALDTERDICPICGEPLFRGKGSANNKYGCRNCNFEIIRTKCSTCGCEYDFTRYTLPKTMNVKDIPGFKVLGRENMLAFKNITEATVEDNQIYPICPHCGE